MSNRRSTLLTDYITSEFKKYEEPERAGKAKGDLIGFSKPKFLAVLLHLVSLKGIEISEICHVPINTFHVWRTEPPFMTAINRHIQQFADVFVDRIIEGGKAFQETSPKHQATFHKALYPLSDIIIFSDQLMDTIFKASNAALQQRQPDDKSESVVHAFSLALRLVFLLRKGVFYPTDDKGTWKMDVMTPLVKEVRKITILDYAEAFQKPWTAPKEVVLVAKTLFQKRVQDILP